MIQEFIILFVINYIGIIISKFFNLPIPGTILGMVLFFILLYKNIIKVEKIEGAVNVLLLNMTILFMPPTVKILDSAHHLQGQFLKILLLILITTIITMGITGKVVQFMIEFTERKEDKNERNFN